MTENLYCLIRQTNIVMKVLIGTNDKNITNIKKIYKLLHKY
jgi:hypothetical protein